MNQEQQKRMRQIGRAAFIREEMVRLGFWPPSEAVASAEAETNAKLRVLYDELAKAQESLDKVAAQIAEVKDIDKLIAQVRKNRIERVRKEREERKVKREQERITRLDQDKQWRKTTLPYLGHGVSQGLIYEGGEDEKLKSCGLPVLHTASEVASVIGITESELAWLTYHRDASAIDHYHRFTIPKRKGGLRVISSPKKKLRVAQGFLLSQILEKLPVHDAAMAFRPGISIADNAKLHAGKAIVIRVDLKDFFPSIRFPRVKRLFQSFGYNEGIASIFALIATEASRVELTMDGVKRYVAINKRCVPQGACTSPALTNLLCRSLDNQLTFASEKRGFKYSRYADDLVFSHDKANACVGGILSDIRNVVKASGFVINEEKTVVLRSCQRQSVTGLVTNQVNRNGQGTPRLSRRDLRRFRAFLHQCGKLGPAEMSQRIGKDAIAYASGYLSFIHMVSPELATRIQINNPWLKKAGK